MESYITAGASLILQQILKCVSGSIVLLHDVCIMWYDKLEGQQKVRYEVQKLPQTFTVVLKLFHKIHICYVTAYFSIEHHIISEEEIVAKAKFFGGWQCQ